MSRIPKTQDLVPRGTRDPRSCQSFFVLGHWISGFLGVLSILHQNTGLFRASELCVTGLKESSRIGNGRLRLPYLIPPQVPRVRSPENSAVLNADQTVMTVLLSGLSVYTRPQLPANVDSFSSSHQYLSNLSPIPSQNWSQESLWISEPIGTKPHIN